MEYQNQKGLCGHILLSKYDIWKLCTHVWVTQVFVAFPYQWCDKCSAVEHYHKYAKWLFF